MGDTFDGVGLAVGEIIGGIEAPGIAGARMRAAQDAVQHRIAQIDIARFHVDPGAQRFGAVGELTGPHAAKQI